MDDKIKLIIEDEEALDVTSEIKDDFLKGEKGEAGPANTLTIGNVISGEEASASIRGKSPNQVLDLVLPRGKISESDYDTVTDMVVSKVEPTLNQNLKESKDYTDNAIIKDFKDISYDQDTCTFVFTRHDNTIFTVDLPIENTVKDGRYDDETKELVLILVSDQEIRIPATGLIDDYIGLDSATIQVVVSADNQITCNILGGSITKTLLTAELQEEINNKVDLETLNNYMKKEDYVDEIVISPTEPTTNEKVWIQKGKNLFDIKKLQNSISHHTTTNITDNTITVTSNGNYGYKYFSYNIPEEFIGKEVTFSFEGVSTAITDDITISSKVLLSNNNNPDGAVITGGDINKTKQRKSWKFTPTQTMLYILFYTTLSSTETMTITVSNIQIEQGSTATEYETYVEKAIHTKNNNGVFEEIANLESKYKLLWKNNNPNSAFEGRDTTGSTPNITLSDNDYDLLLWLYKREIEIDFVASNITPKGYGGYMGYVNTYGKQDNVYREVVRIDDNNFIVSRAYKGSINPDDNNIIPIFVYGIKF